jgi:predicted ribosomally synthesized peptide with SipW-like signal peptide
MNTKIIASLLTIVAVGAVATAGTIAYFTDSVEVSGITLSSGNADLKLSNINSSDPNDWTDGLNVGFNLTNVHPGQIFTDQTFYLKNNSLSEIGLNTWFKLTTVSGNAELCNAILLKFTNVSAGSRSSGRVTDWHSLCDWRDNFGTTGWQMETAAGVVEAIPRGEADQWTASFKVDPNAGNEIAGKTLGVKIYFDAEQVH